MIDDTEDESLNIKLIDFDLIGWGYSLGYGDTIEGKWKKVITKKLGIIAHEMLTGSNPFSQSANTH